MKWTEEKFVTGTGIVVQAKGVGASFRGSRVGAERPDLIICDDIEKDEHVETAEGRAKLERWLRQVAMPALAPQGRLLVLGSMLHYDGLLASLADRTRWPKWDYRVYRALEERAGANAEGRMQNAEGADGNPGGVGARPLTCPVKGRPDSHTSEHADANGRRHGNQRGYVALWPARWSVRRLLDERARIGMRAFEQEYQGRPVDDATRVFRPEWLRRWEEWELVPERLMQVMAVDPATGAEEGDYFALWVGSVDRATGVIYTRELTIERIDFTVQVRRIIAAWRRWRPLKIGIETVAYQAVLKQALDDISRRERMYLPVVALAARGAKRARITAASVFFENGTMRLPPGLDAEVEKQFLHFPRGRHDDGPDVCAMGIEVARMLGVGAATDVFVPAWMRFRDPFDRRIAREEADTGSRLAGW